jgi:hypothetical protein
VLTPPLADYDALVARTNCSSAPDTLECLRGLPYDTLKAAQDASPFFLSYEVRCASFRFSFFDGGICFSSAGGRNAETRVARLALHSFPLHSLVRIR